MAAKGLLGKAVSVANTPVVVYEVPANIQFCTLSLALLNVGTTSAKVRLAVSSSTTPSQAEWLEYDPTIPASGVLERTCIVVSPGEKVVLIGENNNFALRVFGLEQA